MYILSFLNQTRSENEISKMITLHPMSINKVLLPLKANDGLKK
jgi:hypothetical protein